MTIPVVLAIAGCFALLVGIFGGGVQAKEVVVPKISTFSRITSSIIGVILIGTAIWLFTFNGITSQPKREQITKPVIEPRNKDNSSESSIKDHPISFIDIPFTKAEGFGKGITIKKIKAQIEGTNVDFLFDFTSETDRKMSFFNPPNGGIISIRKDVISGVNNILITVSIDELQKVSNITVSFYLPAQGHPDFIFLDFQKIRSLLPTVKSVVNPPDKLHNNIPFAKAEGFSTEITIKEIKAQIEGTNVDFRFDVISKTDRKMNFFNPPNGDIISIRKDIISGINNILITVNIDELQKVSNITVSFYLPAQGQPDFIFLDIQQIKSLLP